MSRSWIRIFNEMNRAQRPLQMRAAPTNPKGRLIDLSRSAFSNPAGPSPASPPISARFKLIPRPVLSTSRSVAGGSCADYLPRAGVRSSCRSAMCTAPSASMLSGQWRGSMVIGLREDTIHSAQPAMPARPSAPFLARCR